MGVRADHIGVHVRSVPELPSWVQIFHATMQSIVGDGTVLRVRLREARLEDEAEDLPPFLGTGGVEGVAALTGTPKACDLWRGPPGVARAAGPCAPDVHDQRHGRRFRPSSEGLWVGRGARTDLGRAGKRRRQVSPRMQGYHIGRDRHLPHPRDIGHPEARITPCRPGHLRRAASTVSDNRPMSWWRLPRAAGSRRAGSINKSTR